MIAVRAIVVRPFTKIEDFISRQAVSVLVKFHLATGGVWKNNVQWLRISVVAQVEQQVIMIAKWC